MEATSRLACPEITRPSAGILSPARTSTTSPACRCSLSVLSSEPSARTRHALLRVSLLSPAIACRVPITLRSSRICPKIIMIGKRAAVIKSPNAQAPSIASTISRSVTPCRSGCSRLCHPARSTGTATSSQATPAKISLIAGCSGAIARHARLNRSNPIVVMTSVS